MAENDFGKGLELDSNLDLVITETGDLGIVSDVAELRKDLAFRLIRQFEQVTGWQNTPEFHKDAELLAKRTVIDDDRVTGVSEFHIEEGDTPDEIEIGLAVETVNGDVELVVAL